MESALILLIVFILLMKYSAMEINILADLAVQ